uniref:MANSC domain-containing protein n=1 Tax=Vespula pensylvanica TaxID=30213 RepID=A0A834KLK8_VESPE|nr:hypothetical protein H0235_013775 [Vespula pensylvanica]
MPYRDLYVFFNFIAIFHCINGEISLKKNEKHADIANNYDACFESFDVHTNKIIKTEDSCDLGAKYLNVLDLESREDCFKYCCDTDKCDVFIFEEKKPGSCYLFECGPLEDFKCKFTTHVNYTSAVLTNYNIRNHPQLEEEIQISQHEHELKSLRKHSNIPPVQYAVTEHSVKPSVAVTSRPIVTTPPAKQGCSHNQYECRSTGDCIAIYNVCDGIPQCTDGSDEAADLVCPTEKPTVPPSVVIQRPSPQLPSNVMKYQQMINQHKKVYHHGSENNPQRWELSQPQNLLYPVQMEKSFGSPAYQWDYQPLYEQNKDSYVPGNSYHGQNNFNPYDQNQPHSFNHKGSSVIGEPDVDRLNSLRFSNVYADSKNPYPSHFLLTPNKGMLQEAQVQLAPSITPNLPQKLDNYLSKDTKNTVSPPCETAVQHTDTLIKDKEIKGKVDKKKQEETSNIKIDEHTTEKSHTIKINVSKQNRERKSELTDYKSIIILETKEHEKSSVVAEPLRQTNSTKLLKPKSAVISLVLGLITSLTTAALIACRLCLIKRRKHRGHGPYAHDPDYLVNGMYL